jgi:membrane-bound serine protease (ClpP class)
MSSEPRAQLVLRFALQLPHTLPAEVERLADFLERQLAAAEQPEPVPDDVQLTLVEMDESALDQRADFLRVQFLFLTIGVRIGDQGAELPKTISEKVTNDAAALIRSLATQRGRPAEWAEKAVLESLSYTEREALEKKLIDLVAADRGELLAALDGREITRFDGARLTLALEAPEIVAVAPNASDKLLSVIAHPNIAYLLLLLGMLGIYFELSHPGAILPGVLGGISLLLALFALSVLPVNYVGILLILLAVVFFIAEVKVTSYGLLAVAGLVSFILGSLMLIDSPFPALRVSLSVVLPSAVVAAAVIIFLLTRVLRSHRARPATGEEGIIGEIGEAAADLDPRGKVFVHGEYWDARATAPVKAGSAVRIVRIVGRQLEVEAADDAGDQLP